MNYMLVTFTTDAYANITMFGDNAFDMLKMMGYSASMPGAIKAEDVPEALNRLKAAAESGKIRRPPGSGNADVPEARMGHRGLPLIDLLSAAARARSHVMWDKSSSMS